MSVQTEMTMLDAIAAHILDEAKKTGKIHSVQVTAHIEHENPSVYRAVYRSEDTPLNRAIHSATHDHGVIAVRSHNI